ncbi:MAG: hypothetical protein JXI43_11770 [Tissierellales bacterium]|nr:hypothetical protein [Tissierellales bacterium]
MKKMIAASLSVIFCLVALIAIGGIGKLNNKQTNKVEASNDHRNKKCFLSVALTNPGGSILFFAQHHCSAGEQAVGWQNRRENIVSGEKQLPITCNSRARGLFGK